MALNWIFRSNLDAEAKKPFLAGANVGRALDRGAAFRGHRLREGGPKVQAEVRDPGEERNQQEGLGAQ